MTNNDKIDKYQYWSFMLKIQFFLTKAEIFTRKNMNSEILSEIKAKFL